MGKQTRNREQLWKGQERKRKGMRRIRVDRRGTAWEMNGADVRSIGREKRGYDVRSIERESAVMAATAWLWLAMAEI